MVETRTKYIGVGTAILAIGLLLGWFVQSNNFDIEVSGDIFCSDTCISYFNITSKFYTYYLYNKEGVKLGFTPEIKEYHICKPDKRCKSCGNCPAGWREIDFTSPYTSRYKYVYKFYKGKKETFMLIGKKEPLETVKWGLEAVNKEICPIWYGINITKLCEWKTIQQDIYGNKTYEYTCPTDYFNWTLEPQIAYCYDKVWNEFNQTYDYPLLYFHNFDYGYKPNKTMYWINYEKVGVKDVQICNKIIGYKVNNKIINCSKYSYGCDNKGTEVCIWYCLDGDCKTKLDFDYVKSRIRDDMIGGWSGKCFDVKDINWHKVKMRLDNAKFRDIVIENA